MGIVGMGRKYFLVIPIVLLGLIAAIALVNHSRPKDAPKKHIRFALCQYGTRLRDMEWNFNHALHVAWRENSFTMARPPLSIHPERSFTGRTPERTSCMPMSP